jgi:hypothetical protein
MQLGSTDMPPRMDPPVHHDDSMQSLLGYNEVQGEWSDHDYTTCLVAVVFVMPLIRDQQVMIKYVARLRMLARMLGDDSPLYRPRLLCLTNDDEGKAANVAGGSKGTNRGSSINNAAEVLDPSPAMSTSWGVPVMPGGVHRCILEIVLDDNK